MTVAEVYENMKSRLDGIVPDFELKYKAEIVEKILVAKVERNAVILAHNYMEPALFHSGIADFTGDSLQLSRDAAETEADVIVFCGVRFMAETAKILSPDKTVLLPARVAGCSLAASITGEDVRNLKKKYPGVPVVTYINCYAEVKAETDICCTSSNARAVIESLDSDQIIFLPDEYLARNVARETGKRIIFPSLKPVPGEKKDDALAYDIIGWTGKCEVHERFTVEDIALARKQFPDVVVVAHPECSPEVVEASDHSGSTTAIIDFIRQSPASQYLVLTECSMADNIQAESKDKEMLRMCSVRCPHMNEITLEDTLASLEKNQYLIEVPEDIRVKALASVERMLAIGPNRD
jgi:quinolinate synthase